MYFWLAVCGPDKVIARGCRKSRKSLEPQRHGGTKEAFFDCRVWLWQAREELCAFVSLWFVFFRPFAIRSQADFCCGWALGHGLVVTCLLWRSGCPTQGGRRFSSIASRSLI